MAWDEVCDHLAVFEIAIIIGSFRKRHYDGRLKTKVIVLTSRASYGWVNGEHVKCISRET